MRDVNLDTGPKSISLLEEHLALLEGREPKASEEKARTEQFATLPERPLNLRRPSKNTRIWTMASTAVLLAACFLGYLWKQPEESDLIAKGSAKVFIIIETHNDRRLLSGAQDLPEGSRVSAEIKATEETIAFLSVFDRNGKALLEPSNIVANVLEIGPGAREHFRTAVELVGPSDGESLAVVACQAAAFHKAFSETQAFVTRYLSTESQVSEADLPDYCGVKKVQLRK